MFSLQFKHLFANDIAKHFNGEIRIDPFFRPLSSASGSAHKQINGVDRVRRAVYIYSAYSGSWIQDNNLQESRVGKS